MGRVHLSLAVVALLVFAGCTGGGAAPSTTVETTEETTAPDSTQVDETETTESTTKDESATSANDSVSQNGNEAFEENVSNVLAEMESQWNYSAGGDLNATEVMRRHVLALAEVESVTVRTTSRTEGSNMTFYSETVTKASENRELYRTNGPILGTIVRYTEGNRSYVKTVRDNETHYTRLGGPNMTAEARTNLSVLMAVQKFRSLWFAPYEEAGTVTRNGTTLTKYEATGPGYYANGTVGNETITSFSATVLVDEDGLVRYFREEIVYERDGNRTTDVGTVRYVDVNATDVSRPNWLNEFEVDNDEDGNE